MKLYALFFGLVAQSAFSINYIAIDDILKPKSLEMAPNATSHWAILGFKANHKYFCQMKTDEGQVGISELHKDNTLLTSTFQEDWQNVTFYLNADNVNYAQHVIVATATELPRRANWHIHCQAYDLSLQNKRDSRGMRNLAAESSKLPVIQRATELSLQSADISQQWILMPGEIHTIHLKRPMQNAYYACAIESPLQPVQYGFTKNNLPFKSRRFLASDKGAFFHMDTALLKIHYLNTIGYKAVFANDGDGLVVVRLQCDMQWSDKRPKVNYGTKAKDDNQIATVLRQSGVGAISDILPTLDIYNQVALELLKINLQDNYQSYLLSPYQPPYIAFGINFKEKHFASIVIEHRDDPESPFVYYFDSIGEGEKNDRRIEILKRAFQESPYSKAEFRDVSPVAYTPLSQTIDDICPTYAAEGITAIINKRRAHEDVERIEIPQATIVAIHKGKRKPTKCKE